MKRILPTIALGVAILSAPAVAQEHGGRGMMEDMSRSQAQQMADAMFQRFDLNHDGIVTRQEADQAAAQFGGGGHATRMIDRLFGDSQSLTLKQAEAQALARFDRDDLNHDGIVTVAERQQARMALKAERAGQAPAAPKAPPAAPKPQ